MFIYQYSENYDKKYKIKDNKVECFSKSKLEDEHPDGNYCVIGETRRHNKKDEIDYIELGGEKLKVCEEGEHSKLFFRRFGYIRETDGDYIALLKRRWLLFWIFWIIILAGVIVFFLMQKPPKVVDEPEAIKYETDTVCIFIPDGYVEYYMLNNIQDYIDADMSLYMTHDGQEDFVLTQRVVLNEIGDPVPGIINFRMLTFELIAGDYTGRMVYEKEGKTTEMPVNIKVRSANTGSMTIGYSDKVTVDKKNRLVSLKFEQGSDATHDVIVQIIAVDGDSEYLLAESTAISAGQKVTELKLAQGSEKFATGTYGGYIRMFVVNGEKVSTETQTDFKVYVTIK